MITRQNKGKKLFQSNQIKAIHTEGYVLWTLSLSHAFKAQFEQNIFR